MFAILYKYLRSVSVVFYICDMFVEPYNNDKIGWIEVICGSMFSGKSEELLRRVKRAQIANLKVEIFKPAIDSRYQEGHVVSHDQQKMPAITITHSSNIVLMMQADTQVVAIDEVQFMDEEIIHVAEQLALEGKRVIVAGLDMDYLKQPFGPMPQLLSIADYITKLHAICVKCGAIANYSYRKTQDEAQVLIGEQETYEPRCRKCYQL
jgi:thymidine kinase